MTTQIEGGDAIVRCEQLGDVFDLPVTVTMVDVEGRQTDLIVPLTERTWNAGFPSSRRPRRFSSIETTRQSRSS